MKYLSPQPYRSHKSAARPFAKFALLASSLMVLAGCNSSDCKRELCEWLPGLFQDSISIRKQSDALRQMEDTREFSMQRRLIAGRLMARNAIAIRLARAVRFPLTHGLTPDSAALFVNALVVHGSVSQVSGRHDSIVIRFLGGYAGAMEREPATEAVEQLIAIIAACAADSVSRRLAKAALRDAAYNPALDTLTRWKIDMVLKNERVVPLRTVEIPPCCESPNEARQTPLDSLAMRMMSGY